MRLIDADKLNRKKKYQFQTKGGCFPRSEWFIKLDDVFRAPTIDAVPVVRCQECGYWSEDGSCESPTNGLIREYTKPTDFCSYGNRRETILAQNPAKDADLSESDAKFISETHEKRTRAIENTRAQSEEANMTKTCLTCEHFEPTTDTCCNPRSDHVGDEMYSEDSCERWELAENLRCGRMDGEGKP